MKGMGREQLVASKDQYTNTRSHSEMKLVSVLGESSVVLPLFVPPEKLILEQSFSNIKLTRIAVATSSALGDPIEFQFQIDTRQRSGNILE